MPPFAARAMAFRELWSKLAFSWPATSCKRREIVPCEIRFKSKR